VPGDTLGYLPDAGVLSALGPTADGEWRAFATESGSRYYRMCTNYRGVQRHSELRTRVATLRRYALLISASPALGSTSRRARLAHPVPFGFHGRYFADLRA
jgi:hypothetical protein